METTSVRGLVRAVAYAARGGDGGSRLSFVASRPPAAPRHASPRRPTPTPTPPAGRAAQHRNEQHDGRAARRHGDVVDRRRRRAAVCQVRHAVPRRLLLVLYGHALTPRPQMRARGTAPNNSAEANFNGVAPIRGGIPLVFRTQCAHQRTHSTRRGGGRAVSAWSGMSRKARCLSPSSGWPLCAARRTTCSWASASH